MTRLTAFGLALAFGALLAGCNTTPVHLDDQFALETGDPVPPYPCRANLVGVRDARPRPDVGTIAGRVVEGDRILEWIAQGLYQTGIRMGSGEDNTEPSLDVEVILRTLHGRSIHTSMSCNIVLEARFGPAEAPVLCKRYRGSSTTLNWAAGREEIDHCFDLALQDALLKLSQDARARCAELVKNN